MLHYKPGCLKRPVLFFCVMRFFAGIGSLAQPALHEHIKTTTNAYAILQQPFYPSYRRAIILIMHSIPACSTNGINDFGNLYLNSIGFAHLSASTWPGPSSYRMQQPFASGQPLAEASRHHHHLHPRGRHHHGALP